MPGYSPGMDESRPQKDRSLPRVAQRAILWVCAAVLAGGQVGCARKDVSDRRIDVITLAQALDYHARSERSDPEVLFLDARRSVIYDEGHIRGAVNLRPNDIDLRVGTDPWLEKKEALIVYGEDPSSAVARAMAKRLIEAGYNTMLRRRVKFYAGGYEEWLATGLPIEVTPAAERAKPDDDAPGGA